MLIEPNLWYTVSICSDMRECTETVQRCMKRLGANNYHIEYDSAAGRNCGPAYIGSVAFVKEGDGVDYEDNQDLDLFLNEFAVK